MRRAQPMKTQTGKKWKRQTTETTTIITMLSRRVTVARSCLLETRINLAIPCLKRKAVGPSLLVSNLNFASFLASLCVAASLDRAPSLMRGLSIGNIPGCRHLAHITTIACFFFSGWVPPSAPIRPKKTVAAKVTIPKAVNRHVSRCIYTTQFSFVLFCRFSTRSGPKT
jgi:hypothetical protein